MSYQIKFRLSKLMGNTVKGITMNIKVPNLILFHFYCEYWICLLYTSRCV